MPHQYKTSKNFDRILDKLQKKDKQLYENLLNKMNEILNSPDIEHYKNLRYDLKEYKRVHVGSFVLVFKYEKSSDLIFFTDFDHHDVIYKK
ncbi:MAG TPA: type II toxin-antitoxin system RelE/ParE family toxin [Candidatus Nanoarchaeia archaeon]|nr:type II toxin-antitoxin system RelE/ParE family toxin [Candidatus Nanoarchaeia archaeon]